MVSFDVGLYLVNRVVFDFIGVVVVIVSNDVIVKMYEVFNGRVRIIFICFFNDWYYFRYGNVLYIYIFFIWFVLLYEMYKWGILKWDINNLFNYIYFVYVVIYCNVGISVFIYCILFVCVYIVVWEEFNE